MAEEESPRYPFDWREEPQPLAPADRAVAERLNHALGDDVRTVQPHILRPLAALDEVEALCRSLDRGRQVPGANDRRSLATDLQLAFTKLGDHTAAALQPAYTELVNTVVTSLPDALDNPGDRLRLIGLVREVRRRLISNDGVAALWQDLHGAVLSGATDDDIRLHGAQLIEAVEFRGFEWRWVRSSVSQYIRRGLFAEVAEELRRPVEQSARVAWFVFGYADLPAGYLRVGQVQFFSSRLWPDGVRNREVLAAAFADYEFPEELTDEVVERELKINPEFVPPKLVYARVELQGPHATGTKNPWAQRTPAAQWSRSYVEALVQASTFKQGGSHWRLLNGYAVYHGGDGWSVSGPFSDPDIYDPVRSTRDPLREGTGEMLEETPKQFAERLAEGAPDAEAAAREVQWHLAVTRQDDPAQRIALFVRGFELALPLRSGDRWQEAVKHYFRDFWALNSAADELVRLALETEQAFNWTNQEEVLAEAPPFIERTATRFSVDVEAFLEAAPVLLERFPSFQPAVRRQLRRVVRWSSTPLLARAEVDRRRQAFDTLLHRAARQRNAVVHGIETVPAVVSGAEHFVARLAATIVATAVEQASSGEPLHEALERGRIIEARRLWRLENEAAPANNVLFGGATDEPSGA